MTVADDCPSDCDRHVTCRERDYDGPMTEDAETGEWVPSCPRPLYVRSWRSLWRWRYQCECGVVENTERAYVLHWRGLPPSVAQVRRWMGDQCLSAWWA